MDTYDTKKWQITGDGLLEAYTGNEECVKIPKGVSSIGYEAFGECKNIKEIFIPDTVTSSEDTFNSYKTLEAITVSENNRYFSSWEGVLFNGGETELLCFPKSKKCHIYEIPKGTLYIGEESFAGSSIKKIIIPHTVKIIRDWAFEKCRETEEIILGDGVEEIGESAFEYCYSLKNIIIPEGVSVIGEYAFGGCLSLTEIKLPQSLEYINPQAFSDCAGLRKLLFPKHLKDTEIILPENCRITEY